MGLVWPSHPYYGDYKDSPFSTRCNFSIEGKQQVLRENINDELIWRLQECEKHVFFSGLSLYDSLSADQISKWWLLVGQDAFIEVLP